MWKPLVGSVSLPTEGDDPGGSLATQGGHVPLSYPYLLAVSREISSAIWKDAGRSPMANLAWM
jgi:hypothetical protein